MFNLNTLVNNINQMYSAEGTYEGLVIVNGIICIINLEQDTLAQCYDLSSCPNLSEIVLSEFEKVNEYDCNHVNEWYGIIDIIKQNCTRINNVSF